MFGKKDGKPQTRIDSLIGAGTRIDGNVTFSGGLRIDAEISGDPVPLPTGLDVSAYRIVQEALTNVVQHGAGAAARLRIEYAARAVRIDVVDDGPAPVTVTPGHGLTGMSERALLFDGHVEWGAVDGGGFRVTAELPYRTAAAR